MNTYTQMPPPPAALPSFPRGHGKSDTHAQTLSNGSPNPNPSAGTPYATITVAQIEHMLVNPTMVQDKLRQVYRGTVIRQRAALVMLPF